MFVRELPHASMKQCYTVSDGKWVLTLTLDEDGWFVVTSPTDPAMITQAKTIPEALANAKDAFALLTESREDSARWAVAR